MKQIAILIPTYHRQEKLLGLVNNINQTSTEVETYFIITPDDVGTKIVLEQLGQKIFVVDGEYGKAINEGYKLTSEPFVFCGADDIEFTKGWDKLLLRSIEGFSITGGIDNWQVSQSGVHISHPLIRRSYVEDVGTVLGCKGVIYNPDKFHYHIDIEVEQLAWHRGVINVNRNCIIHHHHFVNGQAENDVTYQRSAKNLEHDTNSYQAIKKYEYWDFQSMFEGRAVLNPNIMKHLTIVMPIWNCEDYTRRTLNSLMEMTDNTFELILIDDYSTEHDGKTLLADLKAIASTKFIIVKTIANDKQMYCNANWNRGVQEAKGDYIAIINSDIDFLTNGWDTFLIQDIDAGYEIANPFQSDAVYPTTYMKPPHEDPIYHLNIRGACYMLQGKFAKTIFPIPSQLVHWCGDNYISWKAKTWTYDIRVNIYHHISKSGAKVEKKLFWNMVSADVDNWIKLSGDTAMEPIRTICRTNVSLYGG